MPQSNGHVSTDDQREPGEIMGDVLNALERLAAERGCTLVPEIIGPEWSVVRLHRGPAPDPVPSDNHPVIPPATAGLLTQSREGRS